jgi:hypothetical protein
MTSMYSTIYVDDIREIKEQNPFESMMSRFDRAAQLLELDPDLYAVLKGFVSNTISQEARQRGEFDTRQTSTLMRFEPWRRG